MESEYVDCIERQHWRQHPLYKEKRETLEEKCKKKGVKISGGKHLLVKRLATADSSRSLPALDMYSRDISEIPCSTKEITKLPVSRLKQILRFYNIPTQGSKDQLVLWVLAVRTGTTHLLFRRELQALTDLIEAAKLAVREEVKACALANEVVYHKRTFQRATKPSLSDIRPRECASVSNEDREFQDVMPLPEGMSFVMLTTIFDDIRSVIESTMEVNNDKSDPNNVDAMTTPGTRVAVLWTDADIMPGWKPGWYTAVVRSYNQQRDEITIEYISEQGESYAMSVNENAKKGSLKVLKVTCDSDLYEVTEIGARVQVRWSGDDVKGTGWKAGWYAAEVQDFDPDEDIISVVYDREPTQIYQECVTAAISKGELRLVKSVF